MQHRTSRRSGKASFVLLAAVFSAALVICLFAFSGESARTNAGQFMSALASQDVDKLTALSVVHDKTPDQIRKEWKEAVDFGKYYQFYWAIKDVAQDKDSATVRLDVVQNPRSPSSYPAHFELSMVKVGKNWKVDVPQINRDMYPFLPQ